jgi:DNA-nicking Smr family endonuclease
MAPDDDADPVEIPIEDELDLHAFQARDIAAVVEAFVTAAQAAGIKEVRLVHGRGKGVQRGVVQAALERHPAVTAFCDDARSHLGATIATLAPTAAAGGGATADGGRT